MTDVAIPPDALVTDGKGLTVYAGFLDAGSARGFDAALRRSQTGAPAVEDMAADPLAATKADHRKGLTPECIKQMGCIVTVALPARLADMDIAVPFSPVAYWSAWSEMTGVAREPDPLPPRTA